MNWKTILFGVCFLVSSRVEAANILGLFTMISPSHNIIHLATLKVLANAGHNVTIATILPLKDKNPNYHLIHTQLSEEDDRKIRETIKLVTKKQSPFMMMLRNINTMSMLVKIQEKMMFHPKFQELLDNKGNHFDLVILGYVFSDVFLGVADHFKCPVILNWINVPMPGVNELIGNPSGSAYVPLNWLGTKPMGFFKRVLNFVLNGVVSFIMDLSNRGSPPLYERAFPADRGYRSLDEMKKNISLMFCATFFSEGAIRASVPALIEIGGIQVKEKPDPLVQDVEKFVSSAEHGIIFLSLGSNIKSSDFPATQVIYNVLSKRKEKILWKWDADEVPGNSSNILFKNWFAQDDILAHPKTKLFITHGGKGSISEAQYHGVPMLAVPVFGDQRPNSENMQDLGYGLVSKYETNTEEEFNAELEEVLNNSTYHEAIKTFSLLYRDRPMTPRQTVLYWSEYVLRHRGAKHMQSPLVHLNFIQYSGLDILAFIVSVLVSFYYFAKLLICLITKCLRLRRNRKEKRE